MTQEYDQATDQIVQALGAKLGLDADESAFMLRGIKQYLGQCSDELHSEADFVLAVSFFCYGYSSRKIWHDQMKTQANS